MDVNPSVFLKRYDTTLMKDLHFKQLVPEISKSQPVRNLTPASSQASSKESTAFIIGLILRGEVILSATITCIGLLLLALTPGGVTEHRLVTFPHTLNDVWAGLLGLHPQAVIALGLLLLIAIPVITVTTAAIAFALERDRRFTVIALTVLAILITSFLLGKGGA